MRYIRAGFTAIEILVVIVLLGVLGTIAAPAFSDYLNSSRLQFSQQVLETTLGQAFSHTRSHPGDVTVSGEAGRNDITITYNDSTEITVQKLDRGVTIESNFSILFTAPYGDIEEEGDATDIILQGGTYQVKTRVHHESGLVETIDPNLDENEA